MHRAFVLILSLLILIAGCPSQRKTKEDLVSEGIKFVQEKNASRTIILFKNALEKDQNYFEARFQLAKAYYTIGKYESAEKELEKVRRQDPSSKDVQIEMARVLSHTNRPDEALKELSPYLGDDSTDCDALEIAGWAHAVKDDKPGAITLLKRAITFCGELSEPRISLAIVLLAQGDAQEAEKLLTLVLAKEPVNRRALFLLAEIQTSRKDAATAVRTLDRIIQSNPNDIEAQYRKGLLYIDTKEYDKARLLADTVTKQFPKQPEGHRLLGFVHFFKQEHVDAIAAFQRALSLQPNAGVYYALGLSHYYRNEMEQAINQFQRALEISPVMTQARVHLALLLLNRKRTDDAVREARTAVAQDDRNAMAHNVLGSAYLVKGNYTEGIAELNKALELDPSLVDVHVKKGFVAMKRGKGEEAESELLAAVRLKPEAQHTQRILALYYINKNQPSKAIDVLKKGLQGRPSDAVSYYIMGEAYARQNNLNEARAHYEKAKEADPRYDPAYFRIASLDFTQQKQEQGVKEIRSLLDKEPGNVQALLVLASVAEANSDDVEARRNYLAAADTGKAEGIIAAALYLQRAKDPDKALSMLDEGLKKAPTDIRFLEVKGRFLLANRKFKEALAVFEAMDRVNHQIGFAYVVNSYVAMEEHGKALEKVEAEIRSNPTNLGLRAELSRIYLQKGDRTAAAESARDIIKKNPDSPVGYMALALVQESSNEIEKAIETLKSVPKTRSAAIDLMLGNLYARKKNYSTALDQYRQAEKMSPGSDQVLFQKGSVQYAMGKKKEAAEEYQKVIRLNPNHAMALNNLAYLYVEDNKNPSQALHFATRAFMLAPQNVNIQDTLGYVLLRNGRVDQGLNMLKKASEGSSKNPSILYHLALAYKERGDSAKATEQLEKALALGDFPEATEAKALMEKMKK